MLLKNLGRKQVRQYIARNSRLKKLGFNSYADYLKSPNWAMVKISASRKPRFTFCVVCGIKSSHLHHQSYKAIGKRMHLELDQLVPLCALHHLEVHSMPGNIVFRTALKKVKKNYAKRNPPTEERTSDSRVPAIISQLDNSTWKSIVQ